MTNAFRAISQDVFFFAGIRVLLLTGMFKFLHSWYIGVALQYLRRY